jgi:hypothetical protein
LACSATLTVDCARRFPENAVCRCRCANNPGLCGTGIVHPWAQFLVGREPNHPNRRAAIRSILIDFRCSNRLFDVVCAKLFRTSNTRTAAKLCAICDVDHLQNSSAKRIRATIPQRQKPLFHRMFFKFLRFVHKRIASAACARDQVRCCTLDCPASCHFARAYTLR